LKKENDMGFNYCTIDDAKMWMAGLDVSDMPTTLDKIIETEFIPWAKREIDRYIGENFDLTTTNEFYDGSGTPNMVLRHRPIRFIRKAILRLIPAVQWFEFKRPFHLNNIDTLGTDVGNRGGVEPIDDVVVPPFTFPETDTVPDDVKVASGNTANFNNTTLQYERADLFVDMAKGTVIIPPRILFLENQAVPFWNYTFLRGFQNIELEYDYGYENLESLPREIRSACARIVAAAVLSTKGIFAGSSAMSLTSEGFPKSYGDFPYSAHVKSLTEGALTSLSPYKRIRV